MVTERQPGKPYIKLRRGNYWDWVVKNSDPSKEFGVIQEPGTLRMLGYFSPESDPDGYFPLVKQAMLNAIRVWVGKGWLTREELNKFLEE